MVLLIVALASLTVVFFSPFVCPKQANGEIVCGAFLTPVGEVIPRSALPPTNHHQNYSSFSRKSTKNIDRDNSCWAVEHPKCC